MKRRFMSIMLSAVMTAGLLAGCAGGAATATTAARLAERPRMHRRRQLQAAGKDLSTGPCGKQRSLRARRSRWQLTNSLQIQE